MFLRKNRLFRICDTIFTPPGSFSDEKYDVEQKEQMLGKNPNNVGFYSRRPQATKYSPFKDLHCILKSFNFLSF